MNRKQKKRTKQPKYRVVSWFNEYSWGFSQFGYSTKKQALQSKDYEHYIRTVRVYVRTN